MNWLRKILCKWLGVEEISARVTDVEKHFVTKRDDSGKPIETLADVPLSERAKLRKPAGMTWQQHKRWLEATDGGRLTG